jgi:hypothetical protein
MSVQTSSTTSAKLAREEIASTADQNRLDKSVQAHRQQSKAVSISQNRLIDNRAKLARDLIDNISKAGSRRDCIDSRPEQAR